MISEPAAALGLLVGALLVILNVGDTFEAVVLPRRVSRPLRLTRLLRHGLWLLWRRAATVLPKTRRREDFLTIYGPLTVLILLATLVAVVLLPDRVALAAGAATPGPTVGAVERLGVWVTVQLASNSSKAMLPAAPRQTRTRSPPQASLEYGNGAWPRAREVCPWHRDSSPRRCQGGLFGLYWQGDT